MALETPSVAQGNTNRIKENKTKKKNKRKDDGNKKTKGKKFMMFSHVTIQITTIEYLT